MSVREPDKARVECVLTHPLDCYCQWRGDEPPPLPKAGNDCPQCGGRLFPRPDDGNRLRCERCTFELMGM